MERSLIVKEKPLLFILFINDLPNATKFLTLLFADDITFQIGGWDLPSLIPQANLELSKANEWCASDLLTLDTKKKKEKKTIFPALTLSASLS